MEIQVQLDHQDKQVQQVPQVELEIQDPLVQVVEQDLQVPLVQMDKLEQQVLQVQLG